MEKIKVGSQVKWMGSPFDVIEIKKTGLLLRQRFSLRNVLTSTVKPEEVSIIK